MKPLILFVLIYHLQIISSFMIIYLYHFNQFHQINFKYLPHLIQYGINQSILFIIMVVFK